MHRPDTIKHGRLLPFCRVEVASSEFAGKPLLQRHRMVYSLLDCELKEQGVHAIALKTHTEEERQAKLAAGDTATRPSRPKIVAAVETKR